MNIYLHLRAFLGLLFCMLLILAPGHSWSQVSLAWSARYDGPSNVIDQAKAMAVDSAGNTYLTGSGDRNGPLLGGDIVTVKLNPAGELVWTARYDNPGRLADAGNAITVDGAGNVYVTGYSHGHESFITAQDYVTLKYAPDGTQLWAARFSGPTNSPPLATSVEYPRAIVVDAAGNVYVTGSTSDSGGNAKDYLTVKYDANGSLLWSAIFDSPDHGNDHVTSLAVSGTGEVYVGGMAGLVKYGPNGDQVWVRRAFVSEIALDANGNIVTAGQNFIESGDDDEDDVDFQIIKFAPNGDRLWISEHDGGGEENDSASHVRVDGAGNVYVTGTSATRCEWVFDWDSGDEEKRCDIEIITLKLDGNGQQLWAARFGDTNKSLELPVDLEVDAAGNAYVLASEGTFVSTAVLKYSPNGSRVWTVRYRDPNHGWDTPTGLALGLNSDVHVGGYSYWRDGASDDYFALKYVQTNAPGLPVIVTPPQDTTVAKGSNATFTVTATGTAPLQYQWLFNGQPIPQETNATLALTNVEFNAAGYYSVTVSNDVGVVVSPEALLAIRHPLWFYGNTGQRVAVVGMTVRLELVAIGTGPITYQWHLNGTPVAGATNSVLVLSDLQTSQSGVYTLHAFDDVSSAVSAPIRVVVSGLAEQCLSVHVPGDASRRFQTGGFVTTDSAGNVYVAASALGVAKYNAAGVLLWRTPYNGEAAGVVVDSSGNVYVGGFETEDPNWDFLTVKYNSNGAVLWSRLYNGGVNDNDRATGIALDSAGNVIITGWAMGQSGGSEGWHQDYVTIKYNPNGDQLWVAIFDSPEHRQDFPYALAIDSGDNVYVTGHSPGTGTQSSDATTVKYSPNGQQQWVARYRSPMGNAYGWDIAIDPAGNVVVVGNGWGLDSRSDAFVAKYDSNGNQLWLTTYNGAANHHDNFTRLAVDSTGNIYAAGATSRQGTGYPYDTLVTKFNAAGQRLWVARYHSGAYSRAEDLALDSAGNAYAVVFADGPPSGTFATLKFDANGNRVWEARWNQQSFSWPGSVTVDEAGNVFAVGGTDAGASAWNTSRIVLLKYCQDEVEGAPRIVEAPQDGTVSTGEGATFSVSASGTAPLSYKWYFNSHPLPRPGAVTLSLTNVQPAQGGDYYVEVCNDLGCVVSPVARLTVVPPAGHLRAPWVASQTFGFLLDCPPDVPIVIEMSEDLRNWNPVTNNVTVQNLTDFTFPIVTNGPPRFFRARALTEGN